MSENTSLGCSITALALIILTAVIMGAAFFVWKENIADEKKNILPPPPIRHASLSWNVSTSSAAWQERDSFAAFVFNGKMWIAGGLNGNSIVKKRQIDYWKAPHFNDIWSSEDGVTWNEERADAEFPPRRSMSVVNFKGKLWMFGGWSPREGYTHDIWRSDDGVNWQLATSKAPWPLREGQTVEIFQDKLWMMGGVHYDKHETKNDVWFSDDAVNWHLATSSAAWAPRWDHATAVFQNKIWLMGGMNLKNQVLSDAWNSADGIHFRRVLENAPWEARQGHALLVYKDRLWIIGRLNDEENSGPNDVWFSENGTEWQKTDIDPPWSGREDFSALVFKDALWVMGGMDSSWKWRNDVWQASLPF